MKITASVIASRPFILFLEYYKIPDKSHINSRVALSYAR